MVVAAARRGCAPCLAVPERRLGAEKGRARRGSVLGEHKKKSRGQGGRGRPSTKADPRIPRYIKTGRFRNVLPLGAEWSGPSRLSALLGTPRGGVGGASLGVFQLSAFIEWAGMHRDFADCRSGLCVSSELITIKPQFIDRLVQRGTKG